MLKRDKAIDATHLPRKTITTEITTLIAVTTVVVIVLEVVTEVTTGETIEAEAVAAIPEADRHGAGADN